ncbi:hypothetical protein ACP70R_007697 [Stipagrostis hirtigluma subsp. patula]
MGANASHCNDRSRGERQRANTTVSSTAPAGDGGSTSTISAETATGCHVLKVEGYSQTKGVLGVDKCIRSGAFVAGGHTWRLCYFPDGGSEKSADSISIFLHLDDDPPASNGDVRARYRFTLLDHLGRQVDYSSGDSTRSFSSVSPAWGYERFIKKSLLESSYLDESDSFHIRCDVTVIGIRAATTAVEPPPPPDLHLHLGELLASEVGGDMKFDVGDEQITAHRYIVAARSPVLMAQLFGPMKEKTMENIRIDDMDPRVFKAMLHFVYTDSLPEVDEGDKIGMAQHLLVAGDRYGMQRLKLICEGMLLKHIDTSTVATTLALAEQHGCAGLKEECFKFLRFPGNMKMVMESDGFQHLRSSCPSVIEELLAKVAP